MDLGALSKLNPLAKADPHPKPIYKIVVDGKDITSGVQGRLVNLSLTDNRGFESDSLEITLDDSDGRLAIPPRGAEIRVAFGWADTGLVDKGSYTVDGIGHSGAPDILTIRANSAELRSGLTTQRERSWHDVSLGDIVCTIADECDLTPRIPESLAEQAIDHVDQTNESAVNLLTRLARLFDAFATIKDNKLIFMPLAGALTASGKPLAYVVIERSSGDQHNFELADRETYTAVRATYNDVSAGVKGEVIWDKTGDAAERKVPVKPEPAAPTAGQYKDAGKVFSSREAAQKAAHKQWNALKSNKAQRAAYVGVAARYDNRNLGVSGEVRYGQAEEDKARALAQKRADKDAEQLAKLPDGTERALSPSAENAKTLRHVYASKANALRAARAEWRRLQRGVASFGITLAKGRPELFPEIPVTVRGFKPQIDGTDWIIRKVTHNLNDNGLGTALELEIKATEITETESEAPVS